MLRTTDRYILREVTPAFLLGLLVFTFILMLPPIMDVAEDLIAKGVDGGTVARIMATLVPQALGLTIPMALLIGVLMGLGRMSSDRETVALQACGVSIYRMLYPLMLLAIAAGLATCYVLVIALPDANQAFREITYRTVASRAEGEVKPRIFYEDFPNVVLYVREVSITGNGWSDVFLADMRGSEQPDIYVAQYGHVVLDRDRRLVDIVLQNGTGHRVDRVEPGSYELHSFDELVISLDPQSVFPRTGPQRGYPELTIQQLRSEAVRMRELGLSPHRPIMEVHRKFSIPVACLVFTLIGLGLGVTSRKDGKLASFALAITVIFTYYVIMYMGEALANSALMSAHVAMWLPNVVLGLAGAALVLWRSRSVERRVALPFLTRHTARSIPSPKSVGTTPSIVTVPRVGLGTLNILDWYVAKLYLRWVAVAFVGMLGIFYIATFIDLSDELFRDETTGWMLLEYFWYAAPQYAYYVLPMSALVGTLVAVGLLAKTSELTVMKACGISLYRAVVPILLFSLVWGTCLFGLSESVLARSNRRAEALNHQIRSGSPQTFDVFNRKWIVSGDSAIYHYLYFDPDSDELTSLSVYEFEGRPWQLSERTFAARVTFSDVWEGQDVWVRKFSSLDGPSLPYDAATTRKLMDLEPPEYFKTERPDAELMNFRELEAYIEDLRASGFDVVSLLVALHRKISFPFATLILTLIAIPFAVTTGPRGALYGVGVGMSLAFVYWVVMSAFGAIGSAGLLAPAMAAWAPNLLFGASATYLLLTVRT